MYLEDFTKKLEEQVKEKTKKLKDINQKLKNLAETDELTKINNRRSFIKKLSNYIELSKRNDSPLSLLSIDIDFFKSVNDTYGHQVGDEVLKLFTETVKTSLRKVDIFGRIGGEEFAICLQNTPLETAKTIADKILKNVAKTPLITKDNQKINITISIGLCELKKHMNINELLRQADEELYKAKEHGRNQISFR